VERAGHWEHVAAERAASQTADAQSHLEWEQRLTELRGEYEQIRSSLESQRIELERQLATAHAALEEKKSQLAAIAERVKEASSAPPPAISTESLETERLAWQRTLAELRSEIEQVRGELDGERLGRKEVEELRAAHQAERQRWEEEFRAARAELAVRQADLEQRSAELARNEAESSQWRQSAPPAEISGTLVLSKPPVAPESPSAPVEHSDDNFAGTLVLSRPPAADVAEATPPPKAESAAEVLARLGLAPAWEDVSAEPADRSAAPHQAPAFPPSYTPASPHPLPERSKSKESADEDESIEDYMARLLQRVRGDDVGSSYRPATTTVRTMPTLSRTAPPPKPAAAPADPAPAPASSSPPAGLASILGGPTPTSSDEPPKITPEEFVPRSQAPERSERLAAMRDLANSSARSAIDRYAQTKWLSSAAAKFTMSALAGAAAVFLAFFAEGNRLMVYGGGGVSVVASVFWFVQAVRYTQRFFRARREKPRQLTARTSPGQETTP
jgi:hypothetical protein